MLLLCRGDVAAVQEMLLLLLQLLLRLLLLMMTISAVCSVIEKLPRCVCVLLMIMIDKCAPSALRNLL